MIDLPARVDIREVGPRDGLQIEAPIGTDEKIRLIQALVATGVRRIEATAFVSPRAVQAMADAEQVADYVQSIPGVEWSGLVASPNGAKRAIGSGVKTIEYVVSAADGHSQANARRSTQEALDAVDEVGRIVHDAGGRLEVIIATAWDCPFDGPTDPERTASIAARALELGADQLCFGDTIGTTTPVRVWRLLDAVRAAIGGAPGSVDGGDPVPLGAHFHN